MRLILVKFMVKILQKRNPSFGKDLKKISSSNFEIADSSAVQRDAMADEWWKYWINQHAGFEDNEQLFTVLWTVLFK